MGETVLEKVRRSAQIIAEVERVMRCIKEEADHYQVLDINRDAPLEDIRRAYCRAVELIHPHKCRDLIDDGVIRWKLSQAFLRISEAFSVLSRTARRIEYDSQFNRRPRVPLPLPSIPGPLDSNIIPDLRSSIQSAERESTKVGIGSAFGRPELNLPTSRDRRITERLVFRVPVRVVGDGGAWEEVAESRDVSLGGIKLLLSRPVNPGTFLMLEFPMPKALSVNGYKNGLYTVRAVVRHGKEGKQGTFFIGAEFHKP